MKFKGFYAVHTSKDGRRRPVFVANEGHGTVKSTGEEILTYRVQFIRVLGYAGNYPTAQLGYGKVCPVRRSEVSGSYKTAKGALNAAG